MATKAKEGVRFKERSSTTSSSTQANGRRAPRASITGSPDREKQREKPMLHSPKPAVRSSTDVSRAIKPPNTAASSRPLIRKPAEKPPSPSQISKERAPKTSSPSPRTSISSKPTSDKVSKTVKNARTPSSIRGRSAEYGSIPARKREANASTSTAIASDPYAGDASSIKSDQELDTHVDNHDLVDYHDLVDSVDIPPIGKEHVHDEVVLVESSEAKDPETTTEIAIDADVYHVDGSKDDKSEEAQEKPVIVEDEGEASKTEAPDDVVTEAVAMKPAEVVAPVARRPEVAGRKKEAQRSNEVIEEFTNKMTEKRKNKVLALVGAFETVISLQEVEGQPGQQQGKGGPVVEDGSSTTKESTEST